jgi:septum site-determining protein MinD
MAKIISFHSFGRGTGKSCLAANLAALLAGAGRQVGVVDADLASPSQHALWGLNEAEVGCALNRFLLGQCEISQAVLDLTPRLKLAGPGRVWLVPASAHGEEIARVLRGAKGHHLDEALDSLSAWPGVELWLVDTHAGLTEETLSAFAASDQLLVVLPHDPRGYQGTAVTLDVARRLGVPRVMLLLNQLPAAFDPAEAGKRAAETYRCDVVGVLPFAIEQAELGSSGLFAWRHPRHPLTALLQQVAARLVD